MKTAAAAPYTTDIKLDNSDSLATREELSLEEGQRGRVFVLAVAALTGSRQALAGAWHKRERPGVSSSAPVVLHRPVPDLR